MDKKNVITRRKNHLLETDIEMKGMMEIANREEKTDIINIL